MFRCSWRHFWRRISRLPPNWVSVPRDAEQGAVVAAAQEDAAVRRFTEGKEVRKVVYVPNRLLNLVVG